MGNTKGNTKGKGTKGTKGTKGKGKGKGNPTPVSTFVPPTPSKPIQTVPSKCNNPVGMVWVTCINLTHQNGGNLLPRKQYHTVCRGVGGGINYHTVRTQVQRYIQWVNGGRVGTLPRGVTYNPPK